MSRYYQGGRIGGNAVNYPLSASGSGIWTVMDMRDAVTQRINTANPGYPEYVDYPNGSDASFASVTLLNHCNASDNTAQNPLFTSSAGPAGVMITSTSAAAGVARVGGLSAAQSKWGGLSIYSSGGGTSGGFLRFINTSNGFTLGTGDFTVELWLYMTVANANDNIMDPRTTANQVIPLIRFDASTHLAYFVSNADRITGTTVVSQNAWHHIALSRVSGSTYLYLDGTQEGATYTDSNSYVSTTNWYFSGSVLSGSNGVGAACYYQDIRITKGVGRYSGSTCTVPVAPFPDY